MLSVEAIIERLGGAAEAARLAGVGTEAIRKWRQARAVPPKHWTAILSNSDLSIADLSPASSASASSQPLQEPSSMTDLAHQRPDGADAVLVLADGTVLWGRGFGAHTDGARSLGEICFSTGMSGYQETLTDPSFAGQIITFTFPHIGNVGTTGEDDEAINVAARGLVVKQDLTEPSNWRSAQTLGAWLAARSIPGICGVDTRALTRRIRDNGPQTGLISFPADGRFDIPALLDAARGWPGLEGMDLARVVSCTQSYRWREGTWTGGTGPASTPDETAKRVVAVDYGAKRNILRCLVQAGCDVTVVPATATAEEILAHKPDGVFLSNGPGDPAATAEYAVPAIRGVLDAGKPVFGICLGHQLLGLALGAKTYKLEQGHRGANQPVKDLATGRVEITSQNHGFAVDDKTLPADVVVTHTSLFDGSNEGIRSTRLPAFSVQYHPEASPGPSDSFYLFERFVALMNNDICSI
ncbi:glutamine-hydrolyzing carbamoyl-phosphate synthase small subunit [Acetobacteraceae bacterium KSS8]|uniref:Carbamoyl phosphate synthase small chain n=1 Tax=Endosaccharibacter trunci TaxID=2812733 RepID=A0ABT1W2E6_9PROT|nr:glutamine-hydrolyzing carbamoyl-phosphate synthase small subunit [Acetobacteraceae bacterium KSS8]